MTSIEAFNEVVGRWLEKCRDLPPEALEAAQSAYDDAGDAPIMPDHATSALVYLVAEIVQADWQTEDAADWQVPLLFAGRVIAAAKLLEGRKK